MRFERMGAVVSKGKEGADGRSSFAKQTDSSFAICFIGIFAMRSMEAIVR
jgi:hypothetical protein